MKQISEKHYQILLSVLSSQCYLSDSEMIAGYTIKQLKEVRDELINNSNKQILHG